MRDRRDGWTIDMRNGRQLVGRYASRLKGSRTAGDSDDDQSHHVHTLHRWGANLANGYFRCVATKAPCQRERGD